VNKERLLKLADFLDTVHPNKFEISSWLNTGWRARGGCTEAELLDLDCGTTACAVGWACTIPEFKAEGLGFGGIVPMPTLQMPDGKTLTSWEAVREFFGLTQPEALNLFDRGAYATGPYASATTVARKIRLLVERGVEACD
jgi:hypothetical protein